MMGAMADEADAAQRVETLQRSVALEAMRRTVRHLGAPRGADVGDDCEGCGFPIPEERKAVVPGAIRCTACQSLHDRTHMAGR